MSRLFRFLLPALLLVGLLLAPDAALLAAQDAAALWWARVFPALTPYLLVCGLLENGLMARRGTSRMDVRSKRGLLPVFLFGAVGGYPAGAKLLGGLQKQGVFCRSDARRIALFCNLCSPGFLLSIIALGLYGNKRIALPLFLSGFVPALLLFVVYLLREKTPLPMRQLRAKELARTERGGTAKLWTSAVTGAMRAQLSICGCLVACAVLAALLNAGGLPALLARLLQADTHLLEMLFAGLLESTRGVVLTAQTTLSLRMQLSFCAFFMHFGGLSVAMQSFCFLDMDSPAKYVLQKLLLGLCAAVLCWLICPLFLPENTLATMANATNYVQNALATGSILFVCLGSLLFAGILGRVLATPKRQSAD